MKTKPKERLCVVCGEAVLGELLLKDRITCNPECYKRNTRLLVWRWTSEAAQGWRSGG